METPETAKPIALIVTPHSDFIGGAETYNALLSEVLSDCGYHVSYLTAQLPSHRMNGITKLVADMAVKVVGLPAITAFRFRAENPRADLIICNGEHSFGIPSSAKVLNLFHGSYSGYAKSVRQHSSWRRRTSLWRHALIQKLGARKKTVVSVSSYLTQILEDQGINVSRTINTAIPPDSVLTTEILRGRYFYAGTYDFYGKGFDILDQLAAEGRRIDCFTNQDPAGHLHWIPKIPRRELLERMRQYDGLVFPSRFESFGFVPLEAMSVGTPVVMFDVGVGFHLKKEIPELVVDSSLPFDRAVEDFSIKLERLSADRQAYSKRCRDFTMNHYSFFEFRRQWEEIVRERER